MLCIIAGHFGIVSAERFVFTFHVPLFFLLSGYFLSTKVSFLPFMKQKARQLLVPYYVTGVVLLIVATIVNHFVWPEIDALNNAKSMLGALLYGSGHPIASLSRFAKSACCGFSGLSSSRRVSPASHSKPSIRCSPYAS